MELAKQLLGILEELERIYQEMDDPDHMNIFDQYLDDSDIRMLKRGTLGVLLGYEEQQGEEAA